MTREAIIADASCLIVLQNIRELSLLQKLFGTVSVTEEVAAEFGDDLPEWIAIKKVGNKIQQNAISLLLDVGEASSIALALETQNSLLIIDEKKGRRIAREFGVDIVGTLGIIVRANEKGLIDSVETLVSRLEGADFRISKTIKAKILKNN